MAKKISTPASACAEFCTPQDIEHLKDNEAFSLARRIRSAFGNELFVLPPRPYDKGKTHSLYLGNAAGFPVMYVTRRFDSISTGDAFGHTFNGLSPYVDSENAAYVLARTKLKADAHVKINYAKHIPDDYRRGLFDRMIWWMKAATESQQVEVGKTITISAKAQEYLIRLHCGSITGDVIPSMVSAEINTAHNELLRTADFTATTLDQAATMFAREKWMLRDMGSYLIVAAIDASSVCQAAQEIASNKVSPDNAYFCQHGVNIQARFTHEPRAYRSFESMPDEVRASIMSSTAFVKTMLMQDSRIQPQTSPCPGFLGLPFYYDYKSGNRIVSVDGGWVFTCGNGPNNNTPIYGQTILMDKD
jgi:hypothetical protein